MTIATQQAPGVYRRRVGDMLVTALVDGAILLPFEALHNITPDEYDRILRAAGRRPPYVSAINVFLVQWPGHTVLIDTGTRDLFGPIAGKMPANLHAAGVAPQDVTTILLTHLHGDHGGGLLDGAGNPAFPNAELVMSPAENAFWHDDAAKAAAPADRRAGFDNARKWVAPYAARTRLAEAGTVLPGIEALPLPGHTPGHTGYLLGSGAGKLLVWGDVCHIPELQAARPDVTLAFDSNPAQAAETRRHAMAMAADQDLLVTGMHMSFPGFCHIARAGDAFAVQPEPWAELG